MVGSIYFIFSGRPAQLFATLTRTPRTREADRERESICLLRCYCRSFFVSSFNCSIHCVFGSLFYYSFFSRIQIYFNSNNNNSSADVSEAGMSFDCGFGCCVWIFVFLFLSLVDFFEWLILFKKNKNSNSKKQQRLNWWMPKRRTINQRVWAELNSWCCCCSRKTTWAIPAKMRWMLNAKFFRNNFSRSADWLERAMEIPHAYKMDAAAWFGSLWAVFFVRALFSRLPIRCTILPMHVCLCHGLMKRSRAREGEAEKIRWLEWAKYHSSVVVTATFVHPGTNSTQNAVTVHSENCVCVQLLVLLCCFFVALRSRLSCALSACVYVQKWVEEFDACELSSWPWVPAFVLIGSAISCSHSHCNQMNSQFQMVFKSFEKKTNTSKKYRFGKLLIDFRSRWRRKRRFSEIHTQKQTFRAYKVAHRTCRVFVVNKFINFSYANTKNSRWHVCTNAFAKRKASRPKCGCCCCWRCHGYCYVFTVLCLLLVFFRMFNEYISTFLFLCVPENLQLTANIFNCILFERIFIAILMPFVRGKRGPFRRCKNDTLLFRWRYFMDRNQLDRMTWW